MKEFLVIYLFISALSAIYCLGLYESVGPHPRQPRLKSTKKYTPTNSWYQNLLLGNGDSPIQTYPYQTKAKKTGFVISYSGKMINEQKYILEGFLENIIVKVRESLPEPMISQSTIDSSFYDLSAKINYGDKIEITLVRGSPSVIFQFSSVTPVISTIHAILSSTNLINTRSLKLSFNNGQAWIIQSQSEISWNLAGSDVFSQNSYTGWIKISVATSNEAEQALNNNIDSIITNGKLTYSIDRNINPGEVVVKIEYDNNGLFYLLPHVYKASLTGANLINGATAKGIKGTYLLAHGKSYEYKVPIFSSSDTSSAVDTEEKRNNLKEALKNDVQTLKFNVKDPYFGGKELARAANLVDIADLLGDDDSKLKVKNELTKELDNFWFGISSKKSALVYEPSWGGIVSRASVSNDPKDILADFGQYYYNDHHFHYGYFINTAATLAKHFPDYYNSRKEYFNIIIGDFAGTCLYSELPCEARAKDPFLGHSYAAGLFEFADSRNQESTSESVNAYFAVRELGIATNDKKLEDLGDFLLSTEIHSSQIYWQIKSPLDIYEKPFANNGVIGILWETKVDFATFFGGNVEYIFGIQMLPINRITSRLLGKEWLKESRNVWGSAMDSAKEEAWRGILLLGNAVANPLEAGLSEKIHNLKTFDNGNSKTNTLFFYYMVGGSPSDQTIPITNAPDIVTNPPDITSDVGKPEPLCGIYNGCFNTEGKLIGCYDKNVSVCFLGGNVCAKPYLACIDPAKPIQGAPCYLTSQYNCLNGQLVSIG